MIDLLMNADQDATLMLERLIGGPLDEMECAEDLEMDAFFAMAGAIQNSEMRQRASR